MKFAQAMIGLETQDYVAVAVAAEKAGFDSVALSDHVVYPQEFSSPYPYTPDGKPQFDPTWDFPDPWVTIGALASATTNLEFFTNVFVLPARNPINVAKAVGTAAALSGDRVSLGIGAGWLREEFDILEQSFKGRGKRLDEMIEVLHTVWGGGFVEHHGECFDFAPIDMRPAPSRQIPILVGGHSEIALRRAARNDGWIGVNYSLDELSGYASQLHEFRREAGRSAEPFEMVVSVRAAPDASTIEKLEELGVTTILTSAWMAAGRPVPTNAEDAIDAIQQYADRWIRPTRAS